MTGYRKLAAYALASTAIGVAIGAVMGSAAGAQSFDQSMTYNTPFGSAPGEQNQPIQGGTRDPNGNRTIVDGRFVESGVVMQNDGITSGAGRFGGFGPQVQSQAIGNQLNVITQGSWNTVIVDSRQVNNGDVRASAELNGKVKIDD